MDKFTMDFLVNGMEASLTQLDQIYGHMNPLTGKLLQKCCFLDR